MTSGLQQTIGAAGVRLCWTGSAQRFYSSIRRFGVMVELDDQTSLIPALLNDSNANANANANANVRREV
jgi:hypothetical protein